MAEFTYELTADAENVPADPHQPSDTHRLLKPPTEHFGLRRKGSEYLFYGRTVTPPHDFWSHWDGRVYRTLSFDRRTGERRAVIRDTEQKGIYHVQANHMVGFRSVGIDRFDAGRASVDAVPATLPECQEYFVRERFPVRVDVDVRGGKTLVRMRALTYAMSPRTWWFDPSRDWLAVRYEKRDLDAPPQDDAAVPDDAPAGNINVFEVPEAARGGGLWVPMTVVGTYRLDPRDTGNIQTVRRYNFSQFAVGGVSAESLRVPFPRGTFVIDGFAQVAYVVKGESTVEPRPLVVSSGKAHTADDREMADALAANPPGDDVPPSDPARAAAMAKVSAAVK